MKRLHGAANICALDAAWYRAQGIACRYVSNCWPDPFDNAWRDRRQQSERARDGFHILGNIGGLDATGNRFGIQYLANEVAPRLRRRLDGGSWRINICGRGRL